MIRITVLINPDIRNPIRKVEYANTDSATDDTHQRKIDVQSWLTLAGDAVRRGKSMNTEERQTERVDFNFTDTPEAAKPQAATTKPEPDGDDQPIRS